MLSIITPSFGQLDWLKLASASVADQAGVEVEHIIQDAGSEGVEEFQSKFATGKTRFFVEKDEGMYDAINRGLKKARGQICAYLNCDEQYLPGTLKTVTGFFARHDDVDVVFGDMILVNDRGIPISYRRSILPTRSHIRFSHLNTATCSTFFRRRLLDRGFYFDPQWKTIGDAVWIERLLTEGIKMATIPKPLATFTMTGQNLGSSGISEAEVARWKGSNYSGKWVTRTGVILLHRLQKALAGAYRRRHVEVDIFTAESPTQRRHFAEDNVGFSWPT